MHGINIIIKEVNVSANKKVLREDARNKYWSLSKTQKDKKGNIKEDDTT